MQKSSAILPTWDKIVKQDGNMAEMFKKLAQLAQWFKALRYGQMIKQKKVHSSSNSIDWDGGNLNIQIFPLFIKKTSTDATRKHDLIVAHPPTYILH